MGTSTLVYPVILSKDGDGYFVTVPDFDVNTEGRDVVDAIAMARHDNRTVKKNCTIPYYLNVEAEKAGINFSRLLQEALKQKLYG